MWNLKDEAEGNSKDQNKQIFKQMLLNLVGVVPEIGLFEVGAKGELSPADTNDLVLISEFKTWEDLKSYVVHPEHQKVVAFAKLVVSSRSAVDYEF